MELEFVSSNITPTRDLIPNCVRDNNWFIMEVQFNKINIYFNLSVLPNLLQKLLKGKPTWSTGRNCAKFRELLMKRKLVYLEGENIRLRSDIYVSKKENFLLKVLTSMF